MPILKQSEKVANYRLVENLAKYGYAPCKRTSDLWRHATRPMVFTLCVDDFGMKYCGKQHASNMPVILWIPSAQDTKSNATGPEVHI